MHAPEITPTDPHALLEQHRRDIEALDRRILHLVCERLELARQVGDLKGTLAVPLRNFGVEAQVYRRFEDASSLLGLDAGLGRDLARFLIEKAVEEQNRRFSDNTLYVAPLILFRRHSRTINMAIAPRMMNPIIIPIKIE